jgi:hypothetical protein
MNRWTLVGEGEQGGPPAEGGQHDLQQRMNRLGWTLVGEGGQGGLNDECVQHELQGEGGQG